MAKTKKKRSLSSYFREIYNAHPELLEQSNNDEVYRLFKDATGKSVTEQHKQVNSNLKSVLRKQKKIKVRGRRKGRTDDHAASRTAAGRGGVGALQRLEESIDDCLASAKGLDRDGLSSVINNLRRARNEIVLLAGQR